LPNGRRGLAAARLCAQAVAPTLKPCPITQRADALPAQAISLYGTTATIPPAYQITMTKGLPSADVMRWPARHSTLFTIPPVWRGSIDDIIRVTMAASVFDSSLFATAFQQPG